MSLRMEAKLVAKSSTKPVCGPRTIPSLSGSAISLFKDKAVSKTKNCRLVHENIMICLVIKVAHRNLNLFLSSYLMWQKLYLKTNPTELIKAQELIGELNLNLLKIRYIRLFLCRFGKEDLIFISSE